MTILADHQIKKLCCEEGVLSRPMIYPLSPCEKRPGEISYGTTSYGYDVRVGTVFKIFTPTPANGGLAVVDPKSFDPNLFVTIDTKETGSDHVIIPPNSFALCETMETINVPRNVLALCVGKSTYARCGIVLNTTPLEPEWRGKVTIEISNTTPLPAKIYAKEGIAQVLFFQAEKSCKTSYADKGGKYQDQTGLTLPKVD